MSARKREAAAMPDEARNEEPDGGVPPEEELDSEELAPEEAPEEADEEPGPSPLEAAERERDEAIASWQRARADYQNLKRRTLEDIQAALRRERGALLEEVLIVLDYLDMALAAPCEGQEAKNLQQGVRLTRDQLWAMLERQGVAPIATEGAFDPDLHQAVSTVASDEHEPGTILEVVRTGFKQGTGVLRHAQVKVASEPSEEGRDE